jgi:hypothetical protein
LQGFLEAEMKRLRRTRNVWIALVLLLANGLAWWNAVVSTQLVEVEPRLSPDMQVIWDRIRSGQAAGETFHITLTDQQAAEGVAWFLSRHPGVPFSHPQVQTDPEGISARGLVHMFGLRTPVYGRARVGVRDGLPQVTVVEVGVAGLILPQWMLDAILNELKGPLDFSRYDLPIYFTRIELGEGTITGEGIYR